MDKILERIRRETGVSGVILFDRIGERMFKLLPSSFDEQKTEKLEEQLRNCVKDADGNSSVKLRFSSGWLVIRATGEFAILVLAKDDLNYDLLNLAIKASFTTLEYSNGAQAGLNAGSEFDTASVYILRDALNLVARHLAASLGLFAAVDIFRRTKSELLPDFPILKHFAVDNNGGVTLIRGFEKHLDGSVVDAAATWCFRFKEMVNERTPVVGFNLKAVTSEYEKELASAGFYVSYKRVAAKAVRSS